MKTAKIIFVVSAMAFLFANCNNPMHDGNGRHMTNGQTKMNSDSSQKSKSGYQSMH